MFILKRNARDNFKMAIDELCSCQNHLNNAYMNMNENDNKVEVHAALKTVAAALESAQNNLNKYED
ncbi:hypothetical protein [Clostridium sp. B9]|uniref:hypothetical protein n=1 Tax=Clostridium sp. B9 TaxID=3423224 RepID=UPI003D2EA59C